MPSTSDLKPLYAVKIEFVGEPEQAFLPRLASVIRLLSDWQIVLPSGLMVPYCSYMGPIGGSVEKKDAVIDLHHCEADLCRLHRFYTNKTEGDCEDFSLPHMHFRGGGIEEIGAVRGSFYLPSIAREAHLDEKTKNFLEGKE